MLEFFSKNKNVIGLLFFFAFVLLGSSCKSGKACGGGGWYGDRNLSMKEKCPAEKSMNTSASLDKRTDGCAVLP